METALNGFDVFWEAYPRRVGKIAAMKAYKLALKSASPVVIVEGAKRYAEKRRGEDVKFTAHPATWLNGGRWDDDKAQPVAGDCASVPALTPVVFVRAETPQWRAWCAHLGKTPPTNRDFGWFFASEWPPGHVNGR